MEQSASKIYAEEIMAKCKKAGCPSLKLNLSSLTF